MMIKANRAKTPDENVMSVPNFFIFPPNKLPRGRALRQDYCDACLTCFASGVF